jgi:hypothetical protein
VNNLSTSLIAFGAVAVGAVGGYLFAKDHLGREFDERLEREIDQAKEFYRKTAKVEEFSSPERTLETLRPEFVAAAQALTQYSGRFDESKVEVPSVKTTRNIFESVKPDVEWELMVRNRTEEAPYVLTQAEYMEGELEFQQITLTYFEGDNVLVDERDDVVEGDDADMLMGLNNLQHFGLQSEDENVVYVRNHEKELDLQVNRDKRKYSEHVLGLTPEG